LLLLVASIKELYYVCFYTPAKQKGECMLCLAQIETKESVDRAKLRILARQRSEYAWAIVADHDVVPCLQATPYEVGVLVLVRLSEAQEVLEITDAKDWLLMIIRTLLVTGITPQFLQKESERAEQWRQTLTLQSQDLDRRALELEARREKLEQLEETLKREQKQIESLAAQHRDQPEELEKGKSESEAAED
jgi:hypothetical protein